MHVGLVFDLTAVVNGNPGIFNCVILSHSLKNDMLRYKECKNRTMLCPHSPTCSEHLVFTTQQHAACPLSGTTICTHLFPFKMAKKETTGNTKKRLRFTVLCTDLPSLPLKTFILCLDYGVRFLSRQTKHTKCSMANWSNPELRRRETERNQLGRRKPLIKSCMLYRLHQFYFL